MVETVGTIVCSVLVSAVASTGFWTFVQHMMSKKSAEAQMLKGLGHDRICYLGESYVKRGYITKDEYENIVDYLYAPYKELGGDGTAEKIVNEIKKLPMK